VHSFAPQLPRWSTMIVAQQERLADQLARDEYERGADARRLEAAREQARTARAELMRATAREDAVHGLVRQVRQARLQAHERQAEIELEDQGPPAARAQR
jgi:hypothetical protein